MQKFKVHKNCSCYMCKKGKTPKKTKPIERAYRHNTKQELHLKIEEFENGPIPEGYFD